MKELSNLKELELDFRNNKLGVNPNNLKFLSEGLKGLNELESLVLNLIDNGLEKDKKNIKILGD